MDPDNQVQTFVYDGVNKRSETDKRGFTTLFEYDGLNRLTRTIDPLEQEMTTVYDDANRRVIETDKRELTKTTQLDALGRLLSVTRSGITLEQHEYDGNNNRTLSTDANGNQTQFDYDGANRLIARTDAFGTLLATTTTFQYDQVGNLLEEKDGRVTGSDFDVKNTYDALNRLETVTDGEGNVTVFEYDGEGNRTAQIEPEMQRTEFDYGELNELIEVRMDDTGVFEYDYDPNRNRIRQTDGNGHVVEFTYDDLNRVDRMIQDPGGFNLVTDHDYDPNGNEELLTDPKGQEIAFEYDELNRMEAKIYQLTAGDFEVFFRTHRIDYGYDENDNLIRVDELRSSGTDPPVTFTSIKTYDDLDRLETETDSFGRRLEYDYDDQGNRTLLRDPDNKDTVYTYDDLNRLDTLTTEAGETVYEYFPDGLKETVSNPNGTTSAFGYDAADRMTSIEHQGPSGVISSYVYDYDGNGNRLSQIETNAGRTETTTYTYEDVNRLETVTYPDRMVAYEYDLAGNRIQEVTTGADPSDKTFHYDAINRLENITDTATGTELTGYTYDDNGNTTSKTADGVTTTFLYDIRDQLGEVQQGASILGRYGYDYDGRRIVKIGDDGRRHYTYDQLSVITEADEVNDTVSKYDYGLDQLVRLSNRTEGQSFFHLDILGSTVNLTQETGTTRQSIFYDAWGNERDRIGTSANNYTFTGHEKDEETGLIYARARFFDTELGRFLSQDSFIGEPNDTPSLHRYTYAHNRPTYFVDPSGFAVIDARTIDDVRRSFEPIRQGSSPFPPRLLEHPQTRWVRELPSEARQIVAEAMAITDISLNMLETAGFSHLATITIEERDFKEGTIDIEGIYRQLTVKVGKFAWEQEGLWEAFEERLSGAGVGESVDVSDLYSQAWVYSTIRTEETGQLAASSGTWLTASIRRDATIAGLRREQLAPEGYGLEGAFGLGLTTQGYAALGQLGVSVARYGLNRAGRLLGGASAEAGVVAAMRQRLLGLKAWQARTGTSIPSTARISDVGAGFGGHAVVDRIAGEAQGALSHANRMLMAGNQSTPWARLYQRVRGGGSWFEALARRNALHQLSERLLLNNRYILEAREAGYIVQFNRGNLLGLRGPRGGLLRPDIQVGLPNGKWGVLDWTTEAATGKIFKYADPRVPFLINVTLP